MAVSVLQAPAVAHAANYIDRSGEVTVLNAPTMALGVPAEFGWPQPDASNYYEFQDYYQKFTVASTSELTVTVQAPQPAVAGYLPNRLVVSLVTPSGVDRIRTVDKKDSVEVKSDSLVLGTVTAQYKVFPGTYFIKGVQWSNGYNGYGLVTVTATPAPEDFGGEPNDQQVDANAISLNTDYSGTIGYHGKTTADPEKFSQDWYDWYKFTVPKNNYGLNITFARTNDGKEINLNGYLKNDQGSTQGEAISLKASYSLTKLYNVETAGTYYFQVYGWSMANGDTTEYTLRIDGVEPTTITMAAKASVDKGKTVTLKPTVKPATPARTLTWKSSDTSIATVTTAGVVKGVKAGTATVTATVNGVSNTSASTTVTVYQPAKTFKLSKTKLTLKKGKKATLSVKFTPADTSSKYKKLKWKSSNTKIATVNSKGKVTAKKKGKATITATTTTGKKLTCKVTVK
ncbi:MAG: Ig-like domain-containing protein [Propionibacteriaceae bacterium]|nr:Ig-like domain-containing protein [Propionibacteriaceae bacterium]